MFSRVPTLSDNFERSILSPTHSVLNEYLRNQGFHCFFIDLHCFPKYSFSTGGPETISIVQNWWIATGREKTGLYELFKQLVTLFCCGFDIFPGDFRDTSPAVTSKSWKSIEINGFH